MLRNEHGSKEMRLSTNLIRNIPTLRDKLQAAKERFRREKQGEKAALLDMFERAYAKSPLDVKLALDQVLS